MPAVPFPNEIVYSFKTAMDRNLQKGMVKFPVLGRLGIESFTRI